MQQIMSITGRAALSAQDEISGQVFYEGQFCFCFFFIYLVIFKSRLGIRLGGLCIMNRKSHRRSGSRKKKTKKNSFQT